MQCGGTDDTAELNAAIRVGDVSIPRGNTCAAAASLTIPAGTVLRIEKGGLLKPATGQTVTISGQLEAGRYQIFANALAGQGSVKLSPSAPVSTIYPEWWGAVTGTSASQSDPFQQALNNATGRTVLVGQGTWRIDTQLTFTSSGGSVPVQGLKMQGAGMLTTIFDSRVGSNAMLKLDANTSHVNNTSLGFFFGVVVSDFQITTSNTPAGGRGIDLSAGWMVEIARVSIQSLAGDAIRLNNLGVIDDSESSVFLNIHDNSLRLNGGWGFNANLTSGYIGAGLATIERNYIAQNTAGGIRWAGSQAQVINNTFNLNGDGVSAGFGLYFPYNGNYSQTIRVELNEFESNSGGNLRIDGGNNFFVTSNNFNTGNAGTSKIPLINVAVGDGSRVYNADRIVFENNRCRMGTTGGVCYFLNSNARAPYIGHTSYQGTDRVGLTGTGAVAAGTTVTGTGTLFTTEIAAGYWIYVGNEWRKVARIINNTSLTVTVPFTVTANGSAPEKAQNLEVDDLGQDTQITDQRNSIVKQTTEWKSRTVSVAGVTTYLSLNDGAAQRLNFSAAGTQTISAPVVRLNSGRTVYNFDLELMNNASNDLVVTFDSGWIVNDFVTPPAGTQTRAHFIYNPGAGNKWTQVGVWTPVVPRTNSPAQVTANQNDYNPAVPSPYQRWSTNASRDITGLTFNATKTDGQTHYIINVGTNDIVLKNESRTSKPENRFLITTGLDLTLSPNQMAFCLYDSSVSRWRCAKLN